MTPYALVAFAFILLVLGLLALGRWEARHPDARDKE
jgi:hypothetical protein